MLYTIAQAVPPESPYLQYGALGILFAVLVAIFWKAVPQVGRFIERNIDSLRDVIKDGLQGIGLQVGELRKDVTGMETRHTEHMSHVNGRLDKIDTKIDHIGNKVETLVSRKEE